MPLMAQRSGGRDATFQHSSRFCVVTIGKFEDSYEGLDCESLHENGKDDHAERQVQDLLTIGKRGGQAQRKSERQCSAESAPYCYMLPTKRNLFCETIAQWHEQID